MWVKQTFSNLEMTESGFKPRIVQQFDGLRYPHIVVYTLLLKKNRRKEFESLLYNAPTGKVAQNICNSKWQICF